MADSLIGGYFITKGEKARESRIVRPFHAEMFKAIDAWFLGDLPGGKRNLAICIPPRHTKTTLARDIVEFGLGCFPDSEWIYTSYATQLAVDQTVKIRAAVDSDWYRETFSALHTFMDETDGRQDYFRTAFGGSVYGVGAGGSITGFGAGKKRKEFGGAIIIDDPMKADDARSETVRNSVKNWFTGTLLSRRNSDDTPMLLIAQRLHPDDLVGHIKQTMPDDWHFLEIPAVDPGATDTIWPETFSYASAMRMKEVDSFTYNAQYQQSPTIPGGAMIKEEWWRYYTDESDVERRLATKIVTADTAYGVKDANDYSVFQCWGFENDKRLYLIDQVRGKWGYEQLVKVATAFWEKNQPYRMYVENKASGQSLVQQHDLYRELEINCFPWDATKYGVKDKVQRVNESLLWIFNGQVILPDTDQAKSWIGDFINECSMFTMDMSQTHDDQVDAMTMAILIWRGMFGGRASRASGELGGVSE